VKLVLETAVAIDILLQFFTYSTHPPHPKKPLITSSSSACNEKTQNPQTNSTKSSQTLSSSYSHNNKKTKPFPNLRPPYPTPQTTVESQNRIK
jgi:hypothetical protein